MLRCLKYTALLLLLVSAVKAESDLLGKSKAEISSIFGKPDRDSGNAWHYGDSVFFFESGKVSLWSDSGNLSNRLIVKKPVAINATGKKLQREWKNAWTPKKRVSESKVLEKILE